MNWENANTLFDRADRYTGQETDEALYEECAAWAKAAKEVGGITAVAYDAMFKKNYCGPANTSTTGNVACIDVIMAIGAYICFTKRMKFGDLEGMAIYNEYAEAWEGAVFDLFNA